MANNIVDGAAASERSYINDLFSMLLGNVVSYTSPNTGSINRRKTQKEQTK